MEAMTLEREWLASYLDDGGWHDEAANVRNGIDLESYETDLRLIDWLRRHTHLAQPAQAVDADEPLLIGPLPQVFVCSNPRCDERYTSDPHGRCPKCADNGENWSVYPQPAERVSRERP